MILDYDIPANEVQPEDINVMTDYQGTLNNMLTPVSGNATSINTNKPQLTGGESNND